MIKSPVERKSSENPSQDLQEITEETPERKHVMLASICAVCLAMSRWPKPAQYRPKRVCSLKERQGMLGVERVGIGCCVKNLVTQVLHLCLSSAPSKRRKRGLHYLG